jgi:hypothetical protein
METVVTLDATKMGTVVSVMPDQWIASLEMVKGPNPPAQIDSYLPFPWDALPPKCRRLVAAP